MIPAHGEEADAGIVESLRCLRARSDVGIVAVLGQVADLDDELDPLGDELAVDLVDDRHGHAVRVLASRVGRERPLGVGHNAETPACGRRTCVGGAAVVAATGGAKRKRKGGRHESV